MNRRDFLKCSSCSLAAGAVGLYPRLSFAAELGDARLLTYRGDRHGAISEGDPCIVFAAATYLADPSILPPEGAACDQLADPF